MIAALILTFVAVLLIVFTVYFAVTAARQSPAAEMKRKLRRIAESGTDHLAGSSAADLLREETPTDKVLSQLLPLKRLKKLIEHAGLKISPLHFLLLTGIVTVVIFLAVFLAKGKLLLALPVAALTVVMPFIYLGYRRKQRETLFAEQLPDALSMFARSLRAGHSLTAAVELVGQEMPEPAGGLFRVAYEQQKLGIRMADALMTLPERINSIDLHFLVTIIRINSEIGGNLAEILEKLGNTITSRLQIRRQVQVYTAEGRMSAYVLILLPVVVFILFYLRNPGYMNVFFTEQFCQLFLVGAVCGQIIGFFIMKRIVDIRI